MALSWNEIKDRCLAFMNEWADTTREEADAKPWLDAFFEVFGINRKRVALFEQRVELLSGAKGFIDLFWSGVILVEMKSRGKDLEAAYHQALRYTEGLKAHEMPSLIMISDFEHIHLYDMEAGGKCHRFTLDRLLENIERFGILAGYKRQTYRGQDPANIEAAILMGELHDSLKDIGYTGHVLEVYLVRLLFILFAEDTGILQKEQFQRFIEERTSEDGSDLAARIGELFQVLNTSHERRLRNLDKQLLDFEYINGGLFSEPLPIASFDRKMRERLLDCCRIDWSRISPAIFGSMFQSVMDSKARRELGAHYTSEVNILKVLRPLFLDALWQEFEGIKHNKRKLEDFHRRIAGLAFLDPACGCGNFLIVAYRELRLLELEILKILYDDYLSGDSQITQSYYIDDLLRVGVHQFYGIEYEEFPSQIAQVAMWLIDHQMNMEVSRLFGQTYARIPLRDSAHILCADALETEWHELVAPERLSYIIGNPPFLGSKLMSELQRAQVVKAFDASKGSGDIDYVSAWYIKAAQYMQGTQIATAFVSTNSITQGVQVATIWKPLLDLGVKIHFAHRTFQWNNEARGNAAVYCVIIGFGLKEPKERYIYDYQDIRGEAHLRKVSNITPYLSDGANVLIERRAKPLCDVPPMNFGNMPLDGGHLLLSNEEKDELLAQEPQASIYIRPFIGAREYLNGETRWCLWLVDADPHGLKAMPRVLQRIESVRKFRLASKAPSTQKFAVTPALFRDRNNPETYIVVPRVSSERRRYIPMGFFDKTSIVSDTCLAIPEATLYHFGILMSAMHMVWVNAVCGRLKGDYRYSKDIVYNNYPFPEGLSEKQRKDIEEKAQAVLDVRASFEGQSLAELYDPIMMPAALVRAHAELDRAVDKAYRTKPFTSEPERLEHLFALYQRLRSQ
ncbi:MAG: DNA methyltransferase [Porphyromonas sp.]|nr:DNA methyltransferase [Porphyromonas sp.]